MENRNFFLKFFYKKFFPPVQVLYSRVAVRKPPRPMDSKMRGGIAQNPIKENVVFFYFFGLRKKISFLLPLRTASVRGATESARFFVYLQPGQMSRRGKLKLQRFVVPEHSLQVILTVLGFYASQSLQDRAPRSVELQIL